MAAHRNATGKRAGYLQHAIKRYGWNAFEVSVLEECRSVDELNEAEARWIAQLGTIRPSGYNIRSGGMNSRLHESTKEKLRKWHTGRKLTPEHRAKISASGKARHWHPSEEHRAKMLAASKGRIVSADTRARLSLASKRRRATPEQRLRQSQRQRGRHVSEETRLRVYVGENNPRAKLTWEKVGQIRDIYMKGGISQEEIAAQFGVYQTLISLIVRNKIWVKNPTPNLS